MSIIKFTTNKFDYYFYLTVVSLVIQHRKEKTSAGADFIQTSGIR